MSITSKAALLAVVLFSVTLPVLNTYYLKAALTGAVQIIQDTANTVQAGSVVFLERRDISGACDFLAGAHKKDILYFYIIQMNGANICSGPASMEKEINAPYRVFNQPIDSGAVRFTSIQVQNFIVTVGTFNDSWASFWIETKPKIPRMILGWLLGVMGALVLVKIVSLPFKRLTQKHQGQNHRQNKNLLEVIGSSKEATQAHRASDAFEIERAKLKAEIAFIAPDFSKVLTERMAREHAHFPYSFDGTILRFDLNGYTKLYYANDKQMIAKIVRAIAVDIDEMVSRYGGNHYGFGGDEFVELFEGDKQFLRALFCARAIFGIAKRIDLPEEIRNKVKFKAAISSDENMLFSRLPQCYSLVADSLILTNRYFSSIDDRDQNSLIIGSVDAEKVQKFVTLNSLGEHKFKNIDMPVAISRVQSFTDLSEVLRKLKDTGLSQLELFRTDDDIIELLNYLTLEIPEEVKSVLLRHLKGIKVTVCSQEVADTWLNCFVKIVDQEKQSAKVISSYVNTGKNLIPTKMWNEAFTEALLRPSLRKDGRIVADIIETLSYKIQADRFNSLMAELITPESSNRAQGNRLIAQCISNLNQENVTELGVLLRSEQPTVVATGVYCVARVMEYYWQENPVVLSQFLEFQDYLGKIRKLQNSSDQIVSARARVETQALQGVQFG